MSHELLTEARKRAILGAYSIESGPPLIRCSPSWGAALLQEVDAEFHALLYPEPDGRVCVWVDMGFLSDSSGLFTLEVRRAGEVICREQGIASDLVIWLNAEQVLSGRGDLVAELRWQDGTWPPPSRHLHFIAPQLCRQLNMSGCLLVPGAPARSHGPCNEVVVSSISRGFGVELELLTRLTRTLDGDGCGGISGVHAVQGAWQEACRAAAPSEPSWLLTRLSTRWGVDEDKDVVEAAPAIVSRMMAAWRSEMDAASQAEGGDGAIASEHRALVCLLLGEPGAHKTEFRSPLPPHELCFGPRAAPTPAAGVASATGSAAEAELRGFMRLLQGAGAAAASTLTTACYSGTAVHVHVNVRNPLAAGGMLSERELLAVVLEWIRFDLVTARFARPWMWREPSCTPLYASGPELFAGNGQDKAWNTGLRALLPGVAGGTSTLQLGADVPGYVAGVYALLRKPDFLALPEETRLKTLFDQLPEATLGRFCSLNLLRVCSYGTLEVRRFHGTVDGGVVAHWAAFCVGFVEGARADGHGTCAAVLDAPDLATGLRTLRTLQERATLQELATMLDGHVHPSTIARLLADARPAEPGAACTPKPPGTPVADSMPKATSTCTTVTEGDAAPSASPSPSRRPMLPSARRAFMRRSR